MNKYKIGSLFSGIGGIDLGFKKAGFKIKFASDFDLNACKVYMDNFENNISCIDIKNINFKYMPKIDILVAGFPCQAFSLAGKRLGFLDKRGALFFELLRAIVELRPKILFLENVKNLKSCNDGNLFKIILMELKKLNYKIRFKIINTCQYSSIPQNRERIYIVCFQNEKEYNNFRFPNKITRTLKIQDLLEKNVDKKYFYKKSKYFNLLTKHIKNKDTCYQLRRTYVRKNKKKLCPTLTANMGLGGHNVPLILDENCNIRKLTPRECANFQGFPDSFNFNSNFSNSTLYKQIGNSVSIPIIYSIAKNIFKTLQ